MSKYTIDDLFRVKCECEIELHGRKRKYWLRTLSHTAHDWRQNQASKEARLLLQRLKDKKSDDYDTYLSEFDLMDRADLEEAVKEYHAQMDLVREAVKEIRPLDAPEPPDDPTIVDVLEAEEINEQIAKDVDEERDKWVEEAKAAYAEEVKRFKIDELREKAKDYRTKIVINSAYSDMFTSATLYQGVFTDEHCTKRKFKTASEAGEADPVFRARLMQEYMALDVFTGESEELKN